MVAKGRDPQISVGILTGLSPPIKATCSATGRSNPVCFGVLVIRDSTVFWRPTEDWGC